MPDTALEPPVLSRADGAVATLTLNRPKARNALSMAMMTALLQAIEHLGSDETVKVIVLAAGGPAFCAGHDLKELRATSGLDAFQDLFETCSRLMTAIVRCPKPVIAKIDGIATAAGCQLVASCDLAVASEGSRFATPGVNIGLFCSTPMVALSRNIGRKPAMEMLLTGAMIDAEAARGLGLINRAVPADVLDEAVADLAATIAAKSAKTVRIGKEAFYRQADLDLDQAYAYAARVMAENMMTEDAAEGIGAFLDKRDPVWRDA